MITRNHADPEPLLHCDSSSDLYSRIIQQPFPMLFDPTPKATAMHLGIDTDQPQPLSHDLVHRQFRRLGAAASVQGLDFG